jgi:hypothetical protein
MFFTTRQSYTEFERFFKTIMELGLIEHAGDGYIITKRGLECLGLIRALGNLAGTEQINSLYKSSSF